MTAYSKFIKRRHLLAGSAAAAAVVLVGQLLVVSPAYSQNTRGKLSPTETMRGGKNNYIPNAPMVQNLGRGFTVSGVILRSATDQPTANARI